VADVPRKGERALALAYGVGGAGRAVKSWPLASLLMLYYHQVQGLSASAISTVLLLVTLCDALFDPLIGQFSDRLRARGGRRLSLMAASIVPVTAAFVLLWNPPSATPEMLLGFLALCLLLINFFDTLFDLPHLALATELAPSSRARMRLLACRSVFEGLGGLAAAALTYNVLLAERADGSGGVLAADGYPMFSVVIGLLVVLPFVLCIRGLRAHERTPAAVEQRAPRPGLRELAGLLRGRIALLGLVTLLVATGSGIGGSLGLYAYLFIFQFSQAQITALSVLFVAGTLLSAAAPMLGAALGARRSAIWLCWAYATVTALPLLARYLGIFDAGHPLLFALVAVQGFVGAASLSMMMIMVLTLLASEADRIEIRTGRPCVATIVSTHTFARKVAQGVGVLVAGLILARVSFPVGVERDAVPPDILDAMIVRYLAVKMLLLALCPLLLSERFWRRDDTPLAACAPQIAGP